MKILSLFKRKKDFNILSFFSSFLCIVLIISLSGCGIIAQSITEEVSEKDTKIISAVEENREVILESLLSSEGRGDTENEDIPYEEIEYYLNNPEVMIEEVSKTEDGQAVLDLIYGLSSDLPVEELISMAEDLLPAEGYEEEIELFYEYKEEASRLNTNQKYLSLFAGYAAAELAAAIVYAATPWYLVANKTAAASALSAAALALSVTLVLIADDDMPDAVQVALYLASGHCAGYSYSVVVAQICGAFGLGGTGASIMMGVMCAYHVWAIIRIITGI